MILSVLVRKCEGGYRCCFCVLPQKLQYRGAGDEHACWAGGMKEGLTTNNEIVQLLHCLFDSDAGTAASWDAVDGMHPF